MLSVEGVTKTFPGVRALDSVHLSVGAGEVHALLGENGAGKSTLVKILGGALVPDRGNVILDGRKLPLGDPVGTRDAGVSIIYQEFNLVGDLTVTENLFLGREKSRRGWLRRGEMESEARAILSRLGDPCSPRDLVAGLSIGVRQLIEVARALTVDAKLIVFDEPSATLTDKELEHLFATVRNLKEQGIAIIYISHRLEEIFTLADRVTILRDGEWVATAKVDEVDRPQLIQWMVGRALSEEFPERVSAPREMVLELRDLSCPPYFDRVSFGVRAGEVLGLAGLVGSGRTSVGLTLFGVRPPRGGAILLDDEPTLFRSPSEALEAGIAYLTEDRKGAGIFPLLSVAENMTLSNLAEYTKRGFLSRMRLRTVAEECRRRFDIRAPSLDRAIQTLSGGNQQKALLARMFLRPVRVAILDEPTRGVDVGARSEVYRIIASLAEEGMAVVVISAELPELLGTCDRIVVLKEGVTTGELSREEASQERLMEMMT